MSNDLLPTPASLVDIDGNFPAYGPYRGAIADVSTARWDRDAFTWRRRLQRKGWIYLGAYHDDFMVGFAVADAGYIGTAFLYVYDRKRREFVEEKLDVPLGFRDDFAPSMRRGWKLGLGHRHWRIDPEGDGMRLRYEGKRLSCDLRLSTLDGGMTSLAPSRDRPFNHTFKRLCLPITVSARLDERHFDVELPHGGALDFTLGYPPRDTHWNWACLQGTTDDGRPFGLNLVAHFNDEIENALWLGDRLIPLGRGAEFSVGQPPGQQSWTVRHAGLGLDLTFTPEGARSDRKNLGLVKHDFIQPFGRFTGTFRDGDRDVRVEGYGVVEDHTSHW